jgi:hypothetical protein
MQILALELLGCLVLVDNLKLNLLAGGHLQFGWLELVVLDGQREAGHIRRPRRRRERRHGECGCKDEGAHGSRPNNCE